MIPLMDDPRYQHGLRLLARREHSRSELKTKLTRHYSFNGLDAVLDRLEADDYLSDARFATCFVRHRSSLGFGPLKIRHECYQKGLNDAIIDRELSTIDWLPIAKALGRKYCSRSKARHSELQQALVRYLHQRGFSHAHTRDVVAYCAMDVF